MRAHTPVAQVWLRKRCHRSFGPSSKSGGLLVERSSRRRSSFLRLRNTSNANASSTAIAPHGATTTAATVLVVSDDCDDDCSIPRPVMNAARRSIGGSVRPPGHCPAKATSVGMWMMSEKLLARPRRATGTRSIVLLTLSHSKITSSKPSLSRSPLSKKRTDPDAPSNSRPRSACSVRVPSDAFVSTRGGGSRYGSRRAIAIAAVASYKYANTWGGSCAKTDAGGGSKRSLLQSAGLMDFHTLLARSKPSSRIGEISSERKPRIRDFSSSGSLAMSIAGPGTGASGHTQAYPSSMPSCAASSTIVSRSRSKAMRNMMFGAGAPSASGRAIAFTAARAETASP